MPSFILSLLISQETLSQVVALMILRAQLLARYLLLVHLVRGCKGVDIVTASLCVKARLQRFGQKTLKVTNVRPLLKPDSRKIKEYLF